MNEQRKYALLFAATILAARRLHELREVALKPSAARECAIEEAIANAERILEKIEARMK